MERALSTRLVSGLTRSCGPRGAGSLGALSLLRTGHGGGSSTQVQASEVLAWAAEQGRPTMVPGPGPPSDFVQHIHEKFISNLPVIGKNTKMIYRACENYMKF